MTLDEALDRMEECFSVGEPKDSYMGKLYWPIEVDTNRARAVLVQLDNELLKPILDWFKEHNNPSCEESFYQCDGVVLALPELGIACMKALADAQRRAGIEVTK